MAAPAPKRNSVAWRSEPTEHGVPSELGHAARENGTHPRRTISRARQIAGWYNRYAARRRRMAQDLEVFHFEEDRPSFETYARENGFRHWLVSELMVLLGYSSMTPIRNAINRAISACAQLNIS